MDRRNFIKAAAATGAMVALGEFQDLFALGARDREAGKALKKWRKGLFQVHFIYTGAAESIFMIFPDGTTLLLDCGDQNTAALGERAVPCLPDALRRSGEWVARYVRRVNPRGSEVDCMMLSHYHCDHAGAETVYSKEVLRRGLPYRLSGFSEAAEYLSFGKSFDRCWPDFNYPVPLNDDNKKVLSHMRSFYDYMSSERGMSIERFKVGATDQICMLHDAASFPSFSVRNICGNGFIASPDGSLIDLYEELKSRGESIAENALSLGMIISYGPFRFFTAGDFSHRWKRSDGTPVDIEKELAALVPPCQVAKINHHGHVSMPAELVAALRSRVWISSTWNQRHCTDDTLERLVSRETYPGERLVCPELMPLERRLSMQEKGRTPLLDDVAPASFDAGHVVLTVEKGGKEYSISYITAADESMTVRSVMHFKS